MNKFLAAILAASIVATAPGFAFAGCMEGSAAARVSSAKQVAQSRPVATVAPRKVATAAPAPAPVSKISEAAAAPAAAPVKSAAVDATGECKKYFPSVGQLVSVPCTPAN